MAYDVTMKHRPTYTSYNLFNNDHELVTRHAAIESAKPYKECSVGAKFTEKLCIIDLLTVGFIAVSNPYLPTDI